MNGFLFWHFCKRKLLFIVVQNTFKNLCILVNLGPNTKRRLATLLLTLAFSRVSIHSPLEMESLFLTQKGYPIKTLPKGLKFSWGSYIQAASPSKMLAQICMATLLNGTWSKIERPLHCVSQTTPAITRTFHLAKPKKVRVSGSSIKLTGNKEISKWMGSECTPRQRDLTFRKRN